MQEIKRVFRARVYANLCLTVIAACVLFLSYRMASKEAARMRDTAATRDAAPMRVEIVGVSPNLTTPIPCKLMYKKRSSLYAVPKAEWIDEGALHVELVDAGTHRQRMQVEIVAVAADITEALPIKTEVSTGGLLGTESKHEPIAVRLVGIERPQGNGQWHAIPVRGPSTIGGELGGMIGSYPLKVEVER